MVRRIKAKLVLRLREQGLSRNAIAVGYGMSKHSVIDVFDAADRLNVSYDGVEDKTDDEVYALLFPGRGVIESAYEQPDWARVHSELGRVGVTLKLLHAEYADSCRVKGFRSWATTGSASCTPITCCVWASPRGWSARPGVRSRSRCRRRPAATATP